MKSGYFQFGNRIEVSLKIFRRIKSYNLIDGPYNTAGYAQKSKDIYSTSIDSREFCFNHKKVSNW